MMKNRAGWLALIVLAIASLLMVFLVMPAINKDSKPIGDAINAAGNAVKDAVTEPQPTARAPDAAKPADQAAATAPQTTPSAAGQTTPQAAAMTPPSFDVLRVEPDGSTVIAGRAAPHSKLEVSDGAAIVAKVDVGPSGDFAAILDKPLPPGDHQLVLKAIGKDGKTTLSEETATVSVPADKNGKLLAMVTKPGKASRVIATPTPDSATPPGASAAQPAAQAAAASPATNAAPASPALAAPSAAPSANTSVAALPAPPSGSSNLASSAPSIPVSAPASPAATSAAPGLRITAVEIEGNKIFVAGNTKAGTLLRGQADGRPIGTAQAGQDGSFVIEGAIDLAVGDHRIGVEVVGAGGQALVRVEVPFNRPAGDQVAAVAAPQAANNGMSAADSGAFDKLRNETVRAFNLLRGLYTDGRVPSAEQMAAARSATSIALKSLSEYRLPADAAASARVLAETTVQNAAAAVAALDALPKDVASVGAGLKRIGEMIARAVGPTIARELHGVQVTAAAPMTVTDASGTRTIQQEPLTQSERSSVIIRRGDTLWQISRRVYGQGVRYTTIYLANEDQIRNPDVIQPGQIFGVPDAALPDAEELHRQRMIQRRS
ncbi:LysM peptidoglycan-binding domain-containing protein [Neorhizobium galegae]|uniref:LysM peptidoglycan-binding domain-containing protein n=1 Tax=Neorhizobium galegae TaxID=399 RepID=UPI0012D6A451|nr:LysM peptidoglycan-binding domain-containing protein [Neorhizobium galegae]KAB1126419.1 LysM peptidoglycan-binding domain-containing protein [Neorhizobium galegae]MCQ1805395.1 LysM peptidoglycan-binding domain-containing protein [Neorhizobium galegae]